MRFLSLAAFWAAAESVKRPLNRWSAIIIGAFLLYLMLRNL